MRCFSAFFCVLNTMLLCYIMMYCNVVMWYVCMLNNMVVYVNMCIVWYKDIQCCMVYMNSVSMLCVAKSRTPHVCIEQAKSFLSSLPYIHEQPNKQRYSQTNQQLVWYNLVVWMFVRMTASYSLLKNACKVIWRSERMFVYLHIIKTNKN